MSSGDASHQSTSTKSASTTLKTNLSGDNAIGGDVDQDFQPETGAPREDEEIRQSSPANDRVSEKSAAAPEEA